MMRKVFIDTGAFIALAYRGDQYHEVAVQTLQDLSAYPFVTTDHVVGETYTWLRYKVGHQAAHAFLRQVDITSAEEHLEIVFADERLFQKAQEKLGKYADQNLSFTDAISLALLKSDEALTDVFAFDVDLMLAGRAFHPGDLG